METIQCDTTKIANQIGQDLAKEIAKSYEAVIYTYTDKEHIYNHIVINAVSYEDSRKYHAHGTVESNPYFGDVSHAQSLCVFL
ncbi:relaxase/mobilization nuclease domain-containing protein [Ectobacillus funiculus]|uniref:Relaxase/mobilization nuclease domain-containing protein n=1 Tax=Ectobacillus funiculus TaxID=137993 RepID=A0ABV5WD82_9BACI